MIQVNGPWKSGYAFDVHTKESNFTGDNEYGHPTFKTKRSSLGQYIYELKYGQHLPVLDNIVNLIVDDADFKRFIQKIDIILPVPPSNKYRRIQPVLVCCQKISKIFVSVHSIFITELKVCFCPIITLWTKTHI